ncbi:cupin domain-containing protein [Chloroflexota bacterium]
MQKINLDELRKMDNPDAASLFFVKEVLRGIDFGAACGMMGPGHQNAYHYHEKHESIFFVLGGEATVIVEDKEYVLKSNDVMYVAPGEKHQIINKSDQVYRYLEFQIPSPDMADNIKVK